MPPPFNTANNAFKLMDAGLGIATITDSIGTATPTMTRASTGATRLSTGLWRLDVPINTARSYYDTALNYLGYLVEPAATQLITAGDVRDMTGVNWVKSSITILKNAIGIDGVVSAANTLTSTGVNGTALFTLTAAASSRTYSAFVRRKTGTGTVILKHAAGTLDITALINSTTYTQVQLNANTINAAIGFQINTSGDEIEVDCNQFEAGIVATTPIPSSGTRSDDLLATGLAINTGSFVATWTPFNTSNAGIILGASIVSGTFVFMRATSNTTMQCHDGTSTKVPLTVSARANNTTYKTAFGFDGSTISSAEGGINGAGAVFDGSFNGYTMSIGNRTGASSAPFHGCIKDVYNWNITRLSDIVLAGITGTIPVPTVSSVTASNVDEGSTAQFTITLSNSYFTDLSFAYSLSGSATAGVDFTNSPTLTNGCTISGGQITFPAGISSCIVSYPTINNGSITGHLTLGATVVSTSATGTIYDTNGVGDSLTTYAASLLAVDKTSTTDTLNINDFSSNGIVMITPPASGTYTKTVHKVGTGVSKVFSQSRLGYVRLNNATSDRIKIGNANLALTKQHAFGVLCRLSIAQLTSYVGEFELAKTSQNGLSGNPYFRLGIGGNSSATVSVRKFPFAQREGYAASVSAIQTEVSNASNIYGAYPDIFGSNGGSSGDGVWVWIWVLGTSATDEVTPENLSHDGTGTHGRDGIIMAHSLHGIDPNTHSISSRWSYSPLWTTGVVSGINPDTLSNVDFLIGSGSTGSGKTIDIARVIKISSFPGYKRIAEMCAGFHPEALGLLSGDDFCLDFDSLPSGCTSSGSPTYNPAEDGAIAHRYHGTNASDVILSVTNQRIA